MAGLKIVIGGGAFFHQDSWTTESLQTFLDTLTAYGIKEIDSAQSYADSELVLGNAGASEHFDIATKIPGAMAPNSFKKDEIANRTKESLKRLQSKQIDIYYLHSPDRSIPIEETLAGIQEAYESGAFRRFGISNYEPDEVQAIYDHQKAKGWVLPTIYQGNYNPVARHYEQGLLPLLSKLGIAFYAYSPTAGGFLGKTKQQILDGDSQRFANDDSMLSNLYKALYKRPALLDALASWNDIAKEVGTSPYNLATRWVTYNSPLKAEQGDAIIIGARTTEQLKNAVEGLKEGPLPADAVKKIDAIWEAVIHEAPRDNISEFYKAQAQAQAKA